MMQQRPCHGSPNPEGDQAKPLDHEMVVMFTDLAAYTRIAALATPRATASLLGDVLARQIAQVEANGGEIRNLTGDGIMACWPVETPATRSAHCASALRVAFAIVTEAAALISPIEPGRPLALRIGLHIGAAAAEVPLRVAGGVHRTLIGDTVNIAARLQQERRAGDRGTGLGPVRVSENFQYQLPPRMRNLLPHTSIAQVCTRTMKVFSSDPNPARRDPIAA